MTIQDTAMNAHSTCYHKHSNQQAVRIRSGINYKHTELKQQNLHNELVQRVGLFKASCQHQHMTTKNGSYVDTHVRTNIHTLHTVYGRIEAYSE